MDNSYYTGATLQSTLIRGSHHHSHSHHSHNGHGQAPFMSQHHHQPPPSPQLQPQSGSKTSLAGPPLLMQPRNSKNHLFSGAPLIRNGPQQVVGLGQGGNIVPVSPTLPNQSPTHPPGVICCFQPVYYVPMQGNPSMHQLNSPPPPPQQQPLALLPPPMKKMTQQQHQSPPQQQQQGPKRRNYKSLQIPSNKSQQQQQSTGTVSSQIKSSSSHSNLIGSNSQSVSSPNPIKKPSNGSNNSIHSKMSTIDQRDDRSLNNDSPIENIYCNSNGSSSSRSSSSGISSDENDTATTNIHQNNHRTNTTLPFQTTIESTRLTNEEKQRSDKLLNFYFYDEHWRPQEAEPTTTTPLHNNNNNNNFDYNNNELHNGSSIGTCNDFDFDWGNNNNVMTDYGNFPTTSTINNNCHTNGGGGVGIIGTGARLTFNQNPTSNFNLHGSNGVGSLNTTTAATMVVKKKDLEVEAQIVTLANGHRDLEIRLCYVTS